MRKEPLIAQDQMELLQHRNDLAGQQLPVTLQLYIDGSGALHGNARTITHGHTNRISWRHHVHTIFLTKGLTQIHTMSPRINQDRCPVNSSHSA
jgi:hypothetical protein